MASTTGGAHAVCPFYIREYKRSITCEGVGQSDEILHRFSGGQEKAEFQRRYCFGYGFYRCPVARMLWEKYEKDVRG